MGIERTNGQETQGQFEIRNLVLNDQKPSLYEMTEKHRYSDMPLIGRPWKPGLFY